MRFSVQNGWKSRVLVLIARRFPKNRGTTYPQLWFYVPRLPGFLKRLVQLCCGLFGGHELSRTEWGYGGGKYADRWCRWCNKRIQVPKESVWFSFKDSKELMSLVERS